MSTNKILNCFYQKCALSLFLTMIFLLAFHTPPEVSAETNTIDIETYAENMQPGWNLGNSFDAVGTDETAWGNPPVTQDLIKKIADEGYKSIRIPVTFDQRMAEGPDYTIDDDYLNRVDQTVQWALDEGLYVMINIHHDSWIWLEGGMATDHDNSLARYEAIWTQLSAHFKDYSTNLMFESINEPRFQASEEQSQVYLDELNTSFYNIVRESGGKNDSRPLVLPTLDTGSEAHKINPLYDYIKELNDPNILATVHYYGFWPFSVNIAGYTTFEEDTKNDIIQTFDRVHDTFSANGIPVVIGEYGLLGFDTSTDVIQQGEKLKFFEFMLHYAQEKDLVHILWDNGQHLGRTSLEWSDKALIEMLKTSWEVRSATASSNEVYLKKNAEIEDQVLTLNLHGNTFEALLHEGQALTEGEDYQLNGNELILKAGLLESLTGTNDFGTQATLTASFNQGMDWDIEVKTYDTPVLDASEGNASNFVIPTTFNGDRLATMEAVYPSGEAAGPQNWTTYKEFGYTFTPNYQDNEITLRENFFNEVNDGEVELTFHFWSGAEITYTITKSANSITGVPLAEEENETEDQNGNETPDDENEEENDPDKEDEAGKDKEDEKDKEESKDENKNENDAKTEDKNEEQITQKSKVTVQPSVTNNIAKILNADLAEVKNGGTLLVDLKKAENVDLVTLSLTEEQIHRLIDQDVQLSIMHGGFQMDVPASTFSKANGDAEIRLEKLEAVADGLSDVYDLTIVQGETVIEEFMEPITLSFVVDSTKEFDVERLGVYVKNEEADEWELVGGTYEDGKVIASADHFSAFVVLEEAKQVSSAADKAGALLPETATSMFNWLALSGVFFLIGGGLFLRQRWLVKNRV